MSPTPAIQPESPFNPPFNVPHTITLTAVPRGGFASGKGGGLPRLNGNMVALIQGDTSEVFSIMSLETDALVREPDAPGRTWETVDSVDGSGPISMAPGEGLIVTVGFAAGLSLTQTDFTATVLIVAEGTTAPALFEIPIQASVDLIGHVAIDAEGPLLGGILPGQTLDLQARLISTLQHDVVGLFSLDNGPVPIGFPILSSPQVLVSVPAGTTVTVALPVTCAAGTAPGFILDVPFRFVSSVSDGNAAASLRILVLAARIVTVTTDLSLNPFLLAGSSTPYKVTINDSGGLSTIAFSPSPLPAGVSLQLNDPTIIATGAGGATPPEVLEMDMVIVLDAQLQPGNLPPFTLNWTVPATDSTPEITGFLTFNVTVSLPGRIQPGLQPFCVFGDPPGSPTVSPTAWSLKDGRPGKSQRTFSVIGSVNGILSGGSPTTIPIVNEVIAALSVWQASAPALSFKQVAPSPGVDITFNTSNLGSPGAGGVQLGRTRGDGSTVSFTNNPGVLFVPQNPGARSLLSVAIHEIGHALGLLHSTNPGSVMYPNNSGVESLSPEDIGAIRALYGWAPQTSIPNVDSESGPALCACGDTLVLAWRGAGDDDNLHYAISDDGRNWTQLPAVPGAASSHGPSLTWDGSLLWMVWKGADDDEGLYYATWDLLNLWSIVTNIPNVGSSCGPSVAFVAGAPFMVWKGVDDDSGIFFSTFSGTSWAPQQNIGGIGTSDRPAITADPVTGIPRMVWKGVDDDTGLHTSTLRGLFWQPQEDVSWIVLGNGSAGTVGLGRPGSGFGPGLVTSAGKLSMVWRGADDDEDLWYTVAAPDATPSIPAIAEWSTQAHVGFRTSASPAIAVFAGNTFLAWKGEDADTRIFTTFV